MLQRPLYLYLHKYTQVSIILSYRQLLIASQDQFGHDMILYFEADVFIQTMLDFVWFSGYAYHLLFIYSLGCVFGLVVAALHCSLLEHKQGDFIKVEFSTSKFCGVYQDILNTIDHTIMVNSSLQAQFEALLIHIIKQGNSLYWR